MEGHAPFHLAGALDGGSGRFSAVLERVDLAPFGPLLARADYRVNEGSASLESDVELDGEEIRLENRVTLHALELDPPESFQDTYGLPVEIALALMTDLDGAIHLTVPFVLGSEVAEIALGTVLRGALQSAIVSAIASPMKLVGGLLGVGDEASAGRVELPSNEIAFLAGTDQPGPGSRDRLAPWAELLASRPGLAVEIRGIAHSDEAASPEARRALAERRAAAARAQVIQALGEDSGRILLAAPETGGAPVAGPPETAAPAAPASPRTGVRIRLAVVPPSTDQPDAARE